MTLPFGTKYSVCDRNCQFLVVSVVMEFNPLYVASDDEEEGFNNNEIDHSENNESLNSLNDNDEEPGTIFLKSVCVKVVKMIVVKEQANHLYQATLELKFNGYNNLNLNLIDDPLGDY